MLERLFAATLLFLALQSSLQARLTVPSNISAPLYFPPPLLPVIWRQKRQIGNWNYLPYGNGAGGQCTNFNSLCLDWAESGQCNQNPIYMYSNCAGSCSSCQTQTFIVQQGCSEYGYGTCQSMAQRGDCFRYPGYMMWSCPVTCGFCQPGQQSWTYSGGTNFGRGSSFSGGFGQSSSYPSSQYNAGSSYHYYSGPGGQYPSNQYNAGYSYNQYPSNQYNTGFGGQYPSSQNYMGSQSSNYQNPWASYQFSSQNPWSQTSNTWGTSNPYLSSQQYSYPSQQSWSSQSFSSSNQYPQSQYQSQQYPYQNSYSGFGGGPCENFNILCVSWASNGECQRNPSYMQSSCRGACSSCSIQTFQVQQGCIDQDSYCPARMQAGLCIRDVGFMLWKCPVTCGFCQNGQNSFSFSPQQSFLNGQSSFGQSPWSNNYQTSQFGQNYQTSQFGQNYPTSQFGQNYPTSQFGQNYQTSQFGQNPSLFSINPGPSVSFGGQQYNGQSGLGFQGGGSCTNYNLLCLSWALNGQCQQNPIYMNANCAGACSSCQTQTYYIQQGCYDQYSAYCSSIVQNGGCANNIGYMFWKCPVTCGFCQSGSTTVSFSPNQIYSYQRGKRDISLQLTATSKLKRSPGCRNYNPECVSWASRGDCQNNPTFMSNTCPGSCNACSTIEFITSEGCHDYDPVMCNQMAAGGYCISSTHYMLWKCPVSCRFCQDGQQQWTWSDNIALPRNLSLGAVVPSQITQFSNQLSPVASDVTLPNTSTLSVPWPTAQSQTRLWWPTAVPLALQSAATSVSILQPTNSVVLRQIMQAPAANDASALSSTIITVSICLMRFISVIAEHALADIY